MPRRILAALTLLALVAGSPVAPAAAQGTHARARPPEVTMATPAEGEVLRQRVAVVSGVVDGTADGLPGGPPIERAMITVGDEEYEVALSGGRFEQEVILSPGEQTIRVVARNRAGEGSDEATIQADIEPAFLKVILTWEHEGTDVDLWVTDPEGVTTGFVDRAPGPGRQLDIDDVDGLGPETYTITRHIAGRYQIRINYYRGDPTEQFLVRVILFEGTPRERRAERHGALSDADLNGSRPSANVSFSVDLPE